MRGSAAGWREVASVEVGRRRQIWSGPEASDVAREETPDSGEEEGAKKE